MFKDETRPVRDIHQESQELRAIRSRICDSGLIALAIATVPTLPFSLSRATQSGWQGDLFFHLVLAVTIWTIALMRRRLPLEVRAWIAIGALFLSALATELVRGLSSGAELAYCGAVLLALAAIGTRTAVVLAVLAVLATAGVGLGYTTGYLSPLPNQDLIARFETSWLAHISLFAFILIFLITLLGQLEGDLRQLITKFMTGQRELRNQEVTLEETVARRTDELGSSERRLRRILHSTSDGFIMVDRQAIITDVNPSICRMLDRERKDIVGRPFTSLVGNGDPQHLRDSLFDTRAPDDGTRGVEVTLARPDEEPLSCLMHPTPYLNEAGELSGAFAMLIDISPLKKSTRELRQALNRAEAGEKAKSEFIAMMSHEVRTPLNAIIGMTQLLMTTDLDERQRDYAGTVESAGASLLEIINNILDFSKLDTGEVELENMPFRVQNVVDNSMKILLPRAEEKGLAVAISIDPTIPEVVIGDESRLRQILTNLVSNAIKFTEQGSISIDIQNNGHGRQESSPAGSRSWIKVRVTDTGIGIPPELQGRLFQRFTQVESITTRRFGGTGLGLATIKRLADAMGGHVQVESTQGQGSVFEVVLPFYLDPDQAVADRNHTGRGNWTDGGGDDTGGGEQEAQPHDVPRRPLVATPPVAGVINEQPSALRILLADSDAPLRDEALASLAALGHQIATVEDGRQAVERVREGDFDLVILAIRLAGMDGLQTTREIRQLSGRRARTPVVGISTGPRDGDPLICKAMGMDEFITRPVDWRKLLQIFEARHIGVE